MPAPPSATASPGSGSRAGSRSPIPAAASALVKRAGPSRSSTATAGTFSEYCNASAALTSPWKCPSKSAGA